MKIAWMEHKFLGSAAIWMAVTFMAISVAQADIYSWQDDEGVIHFSNQTAPPTAALYMREPEPGPQTLSTENNQSHRRSTIDSEAIRRQAKTEVQLEEANRKLNQALDRVEELTAEVAQSRAQAEAAAETARQAAITAENEAQAAMQIQSSAKELIIIHPAPYHRRYKKLGTDKRFRKPYHYNLKRYDRVKRHTPHSIYSLKHHRPLKHHRAHVHTFATNIPRPIIPERSEIPKAYGIR
ncbi:MAG: DUF4124 domain-containing protein [Desulfobacteraceae bacterium]|jgi:hypothetical protein